MSRTSRLPDGRESRQKVKKRGDNIASVSLRELTKTYHLLRALIFINAVSYYAMNWLLQTYYSKIPATTYNIRFYVLLYRVIVVFRLMLSTFLGRAGDLYPSKSILLSSSLLSASAYSCAAFLLSGHWTCLDRLLCVLYLFMLPGLLVHPLLCSQMYISNLAREMFLTHQAHTVTRRDRRFHLGIMLSGLRLAYALGILTGPFFVSFATHYYCELNIAYFSALVMIGSCYVTGRFVPDVNPIVICSHRILLVRDVISVQALACFFRSSGVELLWLLLAKLLSSIPDHVLRNCMAIFASGTYAYWATPIALSYSQLLALMCVIWILTQEFALGYLLQQEYKERSLMWWNTSVIIISFLLLAQVYHVSLVAALLIPIVVCVTFNHVHYYSSFLKRIDEEDVCLMLGIHTALDVLVKSVIAIICEYLLATWGFEAIGYFGAFMNLASLQILQLVFYGPLLDKTQQHVFTFGKP